MEKQSTSKFLRSVIAVVALFMLAVSGFLLTSCKHVHSEPNDFGACTDCGSIIDWDKFGSQMSTLLDPSFDDLTASLTDLASEVTEVKGDVDSIIGALNVADDGSDIDTIVKNVQAVLDQIENLIGANPSVAAKATAPTITGIANAITSVQETLNKIGAGNIEHVCENHQFDTETPVIEIEPTCERAGAKVYRCVNCNATIALPVNQLEHVAADEPVKENEKLATCTEAGSYDEVYYCKNGCNEPLSTTHVDVPAKGHDWDTENPVTMQPATCTEAGSAVYTCKVCGAQSEEFVLPATGHSYDWTTPVSEEAPKCEVEGSATYKCANCENTITLKPSDEEKPESMTDEQWTAFVAAYKATGHNFKNEDGSENFVWKYGDDIDFSVNEITATKYLVCTVCGHEEVAKGTDGQPVTEQQVHIWKVDTEKTEAQTNIKKLAETDEGYDKSYYGYVNTSCQASAYVYWICEDSNCKLHADDFGFPIEVELKPVEHVWVANPEKPNILPTCETEGHNYWICSVGGEEWDEVIEANGHSWDEDALIDEKPATCTEDGFRTYKCTVCGKTQTDTIPALGHEKIVDTVYEKIDNNTHKVTTTTTCSRENCDYKEVVEKIENHYEGESMLNPTSKDEAEEIAEKYELEVYEKDGKYYFTDAGCDRSGFIMNVCACGHIERDWNSYVPALKHVWSEGVYIEGSCVTAGTIQYTCERCDLIRTETVQNATGHVWKVVNAVAPGCTTNGNKAYAYCETCGAVYEITDGETPNKWSTDYVEGLNYTTDKDAVEAWANIVPTGHTFDEQTYILLAQVDDSCTAPAWKVYVCTVCGVVEGGEGAEDTYKIVKDNAAFEGKPATVTVGEANDEFINFLVGELNKLGEELGFTAEMLKSGTIEGFNIKGIEYVAETGHTLTDKTSSVTDETWGYSDVDTIACKVDTNLDSYADALKFAEFVNSELDKEAFKTAFDAIFGTNDSNRDTYPIKTDGTKPALAGVCKDCGMPIAIADHNEEYYMFMITNGVNGEAYDYSESIDVDNAYVHTDTYLVKDANGNTAYKTQAEIDASEGAWTKVVFTYGEVVGMKYTNPNGSVNCYFEGFCANGCGIDMGHKAQHTFPTSNNYDKYHNCMHGDICVWCSKVLALSDEHNMQDLEEIAASDNEEYAAAAEALYAAAEAAPEEYPWVGKDTENATCKDAAEDWTITVCVSCLLEWYEKGPNFEGWSKVTPENPDGNYTSAVVETTGEHNFEIVAIGDKDSLDCLVGYAEQYVCTVCDYKLTFEAQNAENAPAYYGELKALNEKDYIAETYREAKAHKVAPVYNYFENSNYKPATDTTSAYMNFICVDCGAPLQGYYDNGVAEDGKLRYTMASEEDIDEYLATAGAVAPAFDKVANWGNIQDVRPEDKAAVTTIEFAAGATEDQKEAAVAKAIKDAEAEGATSVYLTISGDFTIGASDTTTFAEGDTVWQAYGITFSADSSVKKIVLDLGGNKLTFGEAASYKVTGEGTVVFSNGSIEANKVDAGSFFLWGYQSEIVLNGIEGVVTSGVIGFGNNVEPKTALGSVVIIDSNIKSSGYFGFSTNASDWQKSKVDVTIENSTITVSTEDGDNCAVMMNVPGTFTVKGSTINADRQGIILRGGEIKASIENTTINLSGKYESKDKYLTGAWKSGNEVPMGGIVLGDNNSAYTPGLATVALNNVTVNVDAEAKGVAKVYVYATAEDVQVDLTITNADADAPTLVADDVVNGSNVTDNADVYKLTIDGAQVVLAPVVDEGNTEEAQG